MSVEFVDTNILVYAHSDDPVRTETARALLERIAIQRTGAIGTQTLAEFYCVITRKFRLSTRLAVAAIEDFRLWRIHRPGFDDIVRSARLQDKFRLSFRDAVMVNSAMESRAEILWTEDLNDGQKFGDLTIRNPFKGVNGQ